MNFYKLISFAFAWLIPNRDKRNQFRDFCNEKYYRNEILSVQKNYINVIKKIKKQKIKKLKVLFLVNEISKWKTQALYDLMKDSEHFEPIIALTIADIQRDFSKERQIEILKENYEYFANKKGMKCIYAWDLETNNAINLEIFKPQIVFYQQPWRLKKIQKPNVVSKYALTCYVPYYVPNYGIISMDCKLFHKFLFRHYVLNKDWENYYKQYLGEFGKNVYGLGHTILDKFYLNKNFKNTKNYVIYAPHWSLYHKNNPNSENYSTFDWNGDLILEYAKLHPEINWVFKPHPTLKSTLEKIGEKSKTEIEQYYSEWEKISETCYDENYFELFLNSDALITDCGSFLIEYFYTGKPLIHLKSKYNSITIPEHIVKVFNTFYPVNNTEELKSTLDKILLEKQDTKKDLRRNVLSEIGIENTYASRNILQDLENVFY